MDRNVTTAPPWYMPIEFTVLGTPAPKGSSRAMMVAGKNGAAAKAVNVPSGSNANRDAQASWNTAVRAAAAAAVGQVTAPPFIGVALRVTISFRMRRPAGHYSKAKKSLGQLLPSAPGWPITKPDKDKLCRATQDAMTGIVYDDDSRICESLVRKKYALPGQEGAWIKIEALT